MTLTDVKPLLIPDLIQQADRTLDVAPVKNIIADLRAVHTFLPQCLANDEELKMTAVFRGAAKEKYQL